MVLIVTGDVTEEGVMEVCDRVFPKTEPDRRRILREPAREPAAHSAKERNTGCRQAKPSSALP